MQASGIMTTRIASVKPVATVAMVAPRVEP